MYFESMFLKQLNSICKKVNSADFWYLMDLILNKFYNPRVVAVFCH